VGDMADWTLEQPPDPDGNEGPCLKCGGVIGKDCPRCGGSGYEPGVAQEELGE